MHPLIIRHTGVEVPVWLNEGWAEVNSTLRPVGKKAALGDVIPGHAQTLGSKKLIDLATLTSVQHDSPLYNERDHAGIFYAESWALVHMLYLSPEYRPAFTKFLLAIGAQKSTEEAFRDGYGKPLAQVEQDFRAYLKRTRVYGGIVDVKLEKSAEEPVVAAPDTFELDLVLADLLSASGKRQQAQIAYEHLAAGGAAHPEIEESLGYLAWSAQDTSGARQHFAKAISAGSKNAQMCFQYAMLEQNAAGQASAIPPLRRAVELKPDYTEARLQLGLAELNAQNWTGALDHLSKIRKVDAEQAVWLFAGLAHANAQLGRRDEARKNAESALKYAKTPDQMDRAEQLIRYLDAQQEYERNAAAQAAAAQTPAAAETPAASNIAPPDIHTAKNPFSPRGEKLSRVEGIAKALDCKGKQADLRVQVGTKLISSPSTTRLASR